MAVIRANCSSAIDVCMVARTKYSAVETTATVVPTMSAVTVSAKRVRKLDRNQCRGVEKSLTASMSVLETRPPNTEDQTQ